MSANAAHDERTSPLLSAQDAEQELSGGTDFTLLPLSEAPRRWWSSFDGWRSRDLYDGFVLA